MTSASDRELSEELTRRFLELRGVRGVFPVSAAAAVLSALTHRADPTGRFVAVDSGGPVPRISARLAIDRTTPSRSVVAAARAVTAEVVGPGAFALDIEIAAVD